MLGAVENAQPELVLHIAQGPYDPQQLACYASGQGRMQIEATTDQWVFKVKPEKPLGPGRSKYNCTIPHASKRSEYYWWSYLIMMPQAANK